ncbi:NUDIX hydrolase, partial [Klebsiella pneumoniae]|uniref:NUDIX hydrolase n=1 Tax=Klebsiella pneumoniae TaxID=573 RepID=UPI001C5574BE
VPTPDYILDLRRAYGSGRLLLPGVTGVVVRDDLEPGRPHVLYGRRADTARWALPSGIVEPDEQPATALAREIEEETHVRVAVERLALLSTDPDVVYANGDRCQYVSMTFRCRYLFGEAAVGDTESTAVDWFPADDPPADLDHLQRRRL